MSDSVDKRIDKYILEAEEFAQPILMHLRTLVHAACPELEETMKWSMPHFVFKGKNLSFMSSFKHHAAFGIRLPSTFKDRHKFLETGDKTAMGNFGKLKSIDHLPKDEIILEYLDKAMKLIVSEKTAVKKS